MSIHFVAVALLPALSDATTVYKPVALVCGSMITGVRRLELNPFGPLHCQKWAVLPTASN